MQYLNAETILPPHILSLVQQYTEGAYLYIPRTQRQPWSPTRKLQTNLRNAEIFSQYQAGCSVSDLAARYFLSPKTVYGILARMKQYYI